VAAANDNADQETVDVADQEIVVAVGEELRRARGSAGWSRPELIKRMRTPVPVNTYACYEQGIRQCSIPRLVEICRTLDVSAPDLIGLALQRLELDLEKSGVRIDLRKVLRDEHDELGPLRQWAHNRIKVDALTADPRVPAVVRLQWAVVKEMAVFCDISRGQLLSHFREFTPESASHR
jgi:transcriptional regulator with XRE-family HTH domain